MLYNQKILQKRGVQYLKTKYWYHDYADEIIFNIIERKEFPCPFSQLAVKRNNLIFSFVEDNSASALRQSADDLREYLARAAQWDGNLATAEPLLMVFNADHFKADTVEGYHAMGWSILQYWHDHDPAPWPSNVSTDPHSPFWSMCFNRAQIFVNMSNPAHISRRSMNLGRAMTFVINPRERFDRVAGDTVQGRKIRALVRDRIEAFDLIPHSPDLGSYQAGELEWVQYGLVDHNRPRQGGCPFHSHAKLIEGDDLALLSTGKLEEGIPTHPRKTA